MQYPASGNQRWCSSARCQVRGTQRLESRCVIRARDVHYTLQFLLQWNLEARRAGMSVEISQPEEGPEVRRTGMVLVEVPLC